MTVVGVGIGITIGFTIPAVFILGILLGVAAEKKDAQDKKK